MESGLVLISLSLSKVVPGVQLDDPSAGSVTRV
jgi:hypothetical protein